MSDHIKKLRQRKADLLKEADGLTAREDELSEKDDLSDDEQEELAAIPDKLEKLVKEDIPRVNKQIEREELLMDEKRSMAPVDDINTDTETEAEDRKQRVEVRKSEGFASFGEQLKAVAQWEMNGSHTSQLPGPLAELYQPGGLDFRADGTGANEGIPSEGGFLVQKDFAAPIFESMFSGGNIMSRVRRVPISGNANGIKVPMLDETSRVDGSRYGGVRGYWLAEGNTLTASQPKFRQLELNLKKLGCLFYATEELLQDTTALEALASQAFTEELTFKTEDAIINGDGSGKPLGLLNSGALVTVAAESGQTAATVQVENILKMYNRLPARSMTRAVWLTHQDVLPQLQQMTIGSGTAVSRLYELPSEAASGQVASPGGTLLGRPVLITEYNATLGTAGDIILVDLDQYMMIDKNGIAQAASMHVRFLFDEMTFRFIFRVDGQPMWRSALTPFKGSTTLSPYVALAARS